MTKQIFKRAFSVLLVMALFLSFIPVPSAFASNNEDEITPLTEDDFTFEEGPYLYPQYDKDNFNLILTKDGNTLYDSTDGISEEEAGLVSGYTTAIELGWYDYVLSLKGAADCKFEGSFELKGREWKEYWEYQTDESWGTPTAMVMFNTAVICNSQPQPAYLVVKDAATQEIITPDYQQMEPEGDGVQMLVYFASVINEGDTYLGDGEWAPWPTRNAVWVATPIDPEYGEKSGALKLGDGNIFKSPDMFIRTVYDKSATFEVPKGSELRLFRPGAAAYTEHRVFEPYEVDESDSEKDIYRFSNLPDRTVLSYLLGGWVEGTDTGYLKKLGKVDGIAGGNPTYTIEASDLERRDNAKRIDSGYREDNLYQNTDDSKFLQLSSGEFFNFEAFRVWQSVGTITGNSFAEPDYHYEVLGDSVVLSAIGALGREKTRITGVKPGVSVIKVTYDAMGNFIAGDSGAYANAIDPVNTGLVIVSVDGNNDAKIKTNIEQTEYDTIYYASKINGEEQDKQYAEYTFKPTADEDLSVRVHDPLHNTVWGEAWTSYDANADGSYTVRLKEGRNIVEVAAGDCVVYYVVNARGVQVNIENKTNPEQPLKVGDTVKLSFEGLSQPIQKMAGIYNPGFPGTCWVQYETKKGRMLQSEGVQYDVILKNDIEFVLTQPGTVKLVDGQMHSGHLGSELGKHRNIPASGMLPNLNASSGSNSPLFSTLPDISLYVDDDREEQELYKMTHGQLHSLEVSIGAVKKSWNPAASSWEALNANRNMADRWTYAGAGPLKIRPVTVNDDVTLSARYFPEDDFGSFTEVSNVTAGSEKTMLDTMQRGKAVYVEITVTPKDLSKGYPQTYTVRVENESNTGYPRLTNLKLTAVTGAADMDFLDGLLRATAEDGADLGYGFLTTRENYTVHVPHTVDKITLTAAQAAESVTINGSAAANNQPSDEISLNTGKNDIPIVCSSGANTMTYTVSVLRDTLPKPIVFEQEDNSQLVLATQTGRTVEPEEDGSYMLSEGKYTYYYSKAGYLTQSSGVEIGADTTHIILPPLEKAEQVFGGVSVRAIAQDRILRDKTTISFTADTLSESKQNLELQGYVAYNHGGYTALHALISAFNTGISKVRFSCYKGVLLPDVAVSGSGPDAGWVCEVNGAVCDPASTMVNDGDKIDFYYNPGYAGMKHVWFEQDFITLKAGEAAELTLLGTDAGRGGEGLAIVGAEIKVNGIAVGTTDASGKISISSDFIAAAGQYTVTAEKTASGHNILTYTYALLAVKKADTPTVEGKTKVSFRLIGDTLHDGIEDHGKYVTWIATKSYTFSGDSVSVYEVFTRALDDAGLEYEGADDNYVTKIKAPAAYGGYWLAEFDNGSNSGWMYTVNGEHPKYGLKDYNVTTGDVIVWHYVDDYKLETSFEGSVPTYPNRWLEARDVNPPSGGSTAVPGENDATVIAPKATAKDGAAAVSVGGSDMNKGIEDARKNESKAIVIEPEISGKASKTSVELPKASVSAMASDTDADLIIVTPTGSVTIPNDALASVASQAGGSTVTVVVEAVEAKALTAEQQKTAGDNPVFDISILSGGKPISSFGGKSLTISLPYTLKAEESADGVTVWYLSDAGELERMTCKYDAKTGLATFTTNHLSAYVVGYDTWQNPFTDVKNGDWFYDAVKFAAQNQLFTGTSDTTFSPGSDMTRAMLVTVLYRLEGKPAVTGTNAFTDVKAGEWYAGAVIWANTNGIVTGYDNNKTFGTNDPVTREQMAAILYRYANYKKYDTARTTDLSAFTDTGSIASYALSAMKWANAEALITGRTATTLAPSGTATRAEVATILMRFTQGLTK